MAVHGIDVTYVSRLARIELTPDEQRQFGAQLGQILAYVDKLNQLDVTGLEPTAHAVPTVNVTRPDELRESLLTDEALRNAPRQANNLFMVPKIVE